MMLVFWFVGAFLLYLYYYYSTLYWKKRGVPYITPTFPIFGNYLPLLLGQESFSALTKRWYDTFPNEPFVGIHGFNKPFLCIRDLGIMKKILIKDFHHFHDRPFFSDENVNVLSSNNLFTLKSSAWRSVRNKLTTVFTSGRMKMMFPLMKECGHELETFLENTKGQTLECREISGRYTTDVISSCAFGIRADTLVNPDNVIRKAAVQLFKPSFFGFVNDFCFTFFHVAAKMFDFTFLDKDATGFLRNVFVNAIEKREAEGTKRNDMIDILIDLRDKNTDNDTYPLVGDRLVAQSLVFFSAGLEPSSSAISFALHELCLNSTIQDRLRKEIKDTIAKHEGLTYEAVQEMKYLDMVVNECLRKYPFPALNFRECNKDYTIEETGLVIEKGVGIAISLFGLHFDPTYFPNPQVFDPERFSDENKGNIPPGAFIPFGDGPRICIGERFGVLSTKLGLIYFIWKFRVVKSPQTKDVIELNPRSLLTFPKYGVPLMFERVEE